MEKIFVKTIFYEKFYIIVGIRWSSITFLLNHKANSLRVYTVYSISIYEISIS